MTAAQLLAPVVDDGGNAATGFDWCCHTIDAAGFPEAAKTLATSRTAALVHFGSHEAAVQALKVFSSSMLGHGPIAFVSTVS